MLDNKMSNLFNPDEIRQMTRRYKDNLKTTYEAIDVQNILDDVNNEVNNNTNNITDVDEYIDGIELFFNSGEYSGNLKVDGNLSVSEIVSGKLVINGVDILERINETTLELERIGNEKLKLKNPEITGGLISSVNIYTSTINKCVLNNCFLNNPNINMNGWSMRNVNIIDSIYASSTVIETNINNSTINSSTLNSCFFNSGLIVSSTINSSTINSCTFRSGLIVSSTITSNTITSSTLNNVQLYSSTINSVDIYNSSILQRLKSQIISITPTSDRWIHIDLSGNTNNMFIFSCTFEPSSLPYFVSVAFVNPQIDNYVVHVSNITRGLRQCMVMLPNNGTRGLSTNEHNYNSLTFVEGGRCGRTMMLITDTGAGRVFDLS